MRAAALSSPWKVESLDAERPKSDGCPLNLSPTSRMKSHVRLIDKQRLRGFVRRRLHARTLDSSLHSEPFTVLTGVLPRQDSLV